MIIKTLLENKPGEEGLACEHGLSLWIKTGSHTILFDTGATDRFAQNARILGLDLSLVDLAVLSHGHYDHGGGLKAFLELNDKAPIYIQQSAFGEHLTPEKEGGWERIGLDPDLKEQERFVRVAGDAEIDETAQLISEILPLRLNPPDNQVMFRTVDDKILPDDFSHEQNLVLRENGLSVLITGCAHKGIVNILERYHEKNGAWPDVVMGGFHLISPTWDSEMIRITTDIAAFMKQLPTRFYTGHCTSREAFGTLKHSLGDQIEEIFTGSELVL